MELSEPKTLKYLNFRETAVQKDPYTSQPLQINLSLSSNITIQKRVVYNIFQMFGDVGGLNDFFLVVLSTIFGFFSDRMMLMSVLPKLFRYSSQGSNELPPKATLNAIHSFSGISFIDIYICRICSNSRNKMRHKAFKQGEEMYQDSLDVVKLVRYGRALRTVLRLFLSSEDRQILRIQRRNTVIET